MTGTKDISEAPCSVSRETREALEVYAALLRKWNRGVNLVASSTLDNLWERHIEDSLQLYRHIPVEAQRLADLGSGGGLPAIPLAIMAMSDSRAIELVLVESDRRKAAFLEHAGREIGLNIKVCAERIETFPPLRAEVLTARALAPLDKLLGYAVRHLVVGGIAILPKGMRAGMELELARKRWRFRVTASPSITDPQAQVLVFSDIANAK